MNVRRANVAYRYMWTAWLNLLRWVALLVMLILLGVAVANRDPGWLIPASVAAGVFVLSLVMFLLESPAVRCLGCGGTLLRAMRCTKHKTAKRVFGSYTLHSTLALASGSYE